MNDEMEKFVKGFAYKKDYSHDQIIAKVQWFYNHLISWSKGFDVNDPEYGDKQAYCKEIINEMISEYYEEFEKILVSKDV